MRVEGKKERGAYRGLLERNQQKGKMMKNGDKKKGSRVEWERIADALRYVAAKIISIEGLRGEAESVEIWDGETSVSLGFGFGDLEMEEYWPYTEATLAGDRSWEKEHEDLYIQRCKAEMHKAKEQAERKKAGKEKEIDERERKTLARLLTKYGMPNEEPEP